MNKQELLSTLATYLRSGIISRSEILALLGPISAEPSTVDPANPESVVFEGKKKFSATNILYLVGTFIILIGIGTLLFRFWDELSSVIRIVLTLGIAIAAYISGILLRTEDKTAGVAALMQGLSGILAPIGIFITLHEMGVARIDIGWVTMVAVGLSVLYILSLALFRSVIFSLFSVIFSTWAIYSSVAYLLTENSTFSMSDTYKYLTLAVGGGYLLLASYVKNTSHKALRRILDIFGILGVFGAILALSGYKPTQSILWELIAILALIAGLYISSVAQNRTILKTTALFIFIFIVKFTAEYFSDSLGWPVALIVGGIVIIGVGYGLVIFNKRIGQKN